MTNIFSNKEFQKLQHLCDKGFNYGEGIIAKSIWSITEGLRKVSFYVLAGAILIFGFVMGSVSIKKHFEEKND